MLLASGSLALTAVLARRWVRASRPLRRRLTPIVFGGATLLVSGGNLFVAKLSDGPPNQTLQNLVLVALIGVPIGVLVDILRARLARLAVGDLVMELNRDREPGASARRARARARRSVAELAYWLPEYEVYADLDGRPLELPERPRRVTSWSTRDGAPVAALVHDARCATSRSCWTRSALLPGSRSRTRACSELRARIASCAARARDRRGRRRPSAGGSSATCTTARSSGWSRSRSSCGLLETRLGDDPEALPRARAGDAGS